MLRGFGRLGRFWRKECCNTSSISPEQPFFAIGDLHGCSDSVLANLLAQLSDQDPTCPLVFLGDYIDRGENSSGILEMLLMMRASRRQEIVFLRGNHEQMLLGFLAEPEKHGQDWLNSGGLQTLVSYGLKPPSGGAALQRDALVELRDQLASKLDGRIQGLLSEMPLCWMSGNVFASHAGRDERVGVHKQDAQVLLWGNETRDSQNGDGIWTVQGHLIVSKPVIRHQRIFVDTGAYATSILSAAYITEGNVRFFSTLGRALPVQSRSP